MTEGLGGLLVRAMSAPPEDDGDALAERILDAALAQVAAVGVRRTTIDEVARRAGVGRVTVFRRFGHRGRLLEVLAVREAHRFLATIESATAELGDPREQLVASFVTGLRLARGHPLLDRLARIEPETVLTALAEDRPPVMTIARELLARRIRDAATRGAVAVADADQVAEALLRLAVSFLLLPHSVVDLDDPESSAAFAAAVIAPMLPPARP